MSSLTDAEKRYFETLFGMSSGYVLDYTDASFALFFRRYQVDIHAVSYRTYGRSKAKKIRAFWDQESDHLVGCVLSEMLDVYEANATINGRDVNVSLLEKARASVSRLLGLSSPTKTAQTDGDFLHSDIALPDIIKLPVEDMAMSVIASRLREIELTLKAGAHLSTIFLCGSVLEAVLLGSAQKEPARFNRAQGSPKSADGRVRRLHKWSLAQLIDVACELGVLKPDVKKFSHGLRDFRNYIHPYEQMASGFTPDHYTAQVCFQVLKAACASIAGERA